MNNQSSNIKVNKLHRIRNSYCKANKFINNFTVAFILLIFLQVHVKAQLTKPAVFLSQKEMTPSGGRPYDEFYWLNSNGASLTKINVNFPVTGSYRCDISAYLDKGTPGIGVLIDGVSCGKIVVNTSRINIFSLLIPRVSAGLHTVTLQLKNFNAGANYGKVGLIYFTHTSESLPYVYPSILPQPFTPGVTMLTANHFQSGHLRGFCLGRNGSNKTGETAQNMIDLKATGANIVRCFVEIERPFGDSYQFKAGELTKLDSTVARGKRLGFYVIPVLFPTPSLYADYWGNKARKLSIASLWRTIATKYKGNPVIAAYDLINEPRRNNNYAECIRWQTDMIETIRSVDPVHVVMVECISNKMFAMMLPLSYPNVVYSPHGYSTLKITHQGVRGQSKDSVRNKYPSIKGSLNLIAPWGKEQLSAQHDDVRTMSHRFHVPIFIGEFSCINWAPINDENKWTSTSWVNDNISLIEAEGWSWAYHSWRGEYAGWEAEIPSAYYTKFSFSNGAPKELPPYLTWIKARSNTAPTITMLKHWFALNKQNNPVTAINKQSIPNIMVTNDTVCESQGTAKSIVTLSTTSSLPVTVSFSTADGTAIYDEDYRKQANGSITIPAGTLTGIIEVEIIKDKIKENIERFYIKLTNSINATINQDTATIIIVDEESQITTIKYSDTNLNTIILK